MIGPVLLFGLFSLTTAFAWNFNSLLGTRFITGLGSGAAMPNPIALSAESVETRCRGTAVAIMYCGIPMGGALAALINLLGFNGLAGDVLFRRGGAVAGGTAAVGVSGRVCGFSFVQ